MSQHDCATTQQLGASGGIANEEKREYITTSRTIPFLKSFARG